MRMSHLLLPTERQAPADAEALSHKLLVRAGLIRQLGAGLWSWLPAGWRAHEKAVQIIREEMDAVGAQEMLMPILLPAEMWKKTGRYDIDEMFKLNDRKGTELVLAITHEEAVTTHVAQLVRSYRDLPIVLYQFQTKERDEPRPRAGVLRTREFIMKDAYSFDRDIEGMNASYDRNRGAYAKVFDRAGLRWYEVESDVGMMGGAGAHEYMAPCAAGEDDVALAPGYAANVEIAVADAQPVDLPAPLPTPEPVTTPGATTITDVAALLGVPEGALLKAFPVVLDSGVPQLVLVRGDHRVNELKLRKVFGQGFRPASADEVARTIGPPGFLGPVGLGGTPVLLDAAVDTDAGWITGANKDDTHLRGVQPGRDFAFRQEDIRVVEAGDTVDGHPVTIEPAIEIGNIFKLGLRYSQPLGASYLDETGQERDIWMGSYGIGPARIVASAVEQFADDAGISWPRSLAPYDLELVSLGKVDTPERMAAEAAYAELTEAGFDVLFDDRDAGPGEKFKDAELLGLPLRLTIGKRSLDSGRVEAQIRRGLQDVEGGLPLDDLSASVRALWDEPLSDDPSRRPSPSGDGAPHADGSPSAVHAWRNPKLTFRRLSGLDRTGPPPPMTQAGAPLNPWTIPNAIGFFRLLLIPVFLVVAFSSEDGSGLWPALLFGIVSWGDYADGIAARVTGQYSRLGALLDPVTDRLLVASGVIVCWWGDLLPRWALAILIARELLMLVAGPWYVRRGLELKINWPGRAGVWPVMSALFFALCGLRTFSAVLLYIGLVFVIWATVEYGRDALRQLDERKVPPAPSS